MAITEQARAVAGRAARSKPLELLARVGFVAYGLTHLVVAWLAVRIAFGEPAPAGDQSGALRTLTAQPGGRLLVVAACVGLAAMAVWQLLEASVGHVSERAPTRTLERLASAGRALFYGYLGYTAGRVAAGPGPSSADTQQSTTARLMTSGGGRTAVMLAGVAILCFGIGLAAYGLTKRFEKHLRIGEMSARVRRTSRRLGMIGYPAKGCAYGIAGGLLIAAVRTYDPGKAGGLDTALRTLAAQPYGTWLLLAVGAGIASFAAFCVVQARYRRI
jgi:hypothetical protein